MEAVAILALPSSLIALPSRQRRQTQNLRSPLVLRLEAVKDASDRVGGHLGRRELGYPFVLVHCLPGAREQLVDAYGTL